MLSPQEFASRVDDAEKAGGIVEVPNDLLNQIAGGGPGDFHDVFNDSHVEGGVGPSFRDNFSDRYPFNDLPTMNPG